MFTRTCVHVPRPSTSSRTESSGLFGGERSSLWSGWSAGWSELAGETPKEKLLRYIYYVGGPLPQDMRAMQYAVRVMKAEMAEEEAKKARRRAQHYGKAYGKLVWRLLSRAQRQPQCALSLLPRDVLRVVTGRVIAAETARLEQLYSARLAAGAPSYRG